MVGLLDYLSAFNTGNGVGTMTDYLTGPYYQSPITTKDKQDTKDFASALSQDPYGALVSAPSFSPFDRPGINYVPAPAPAAPNPFDTGGAAPLSGLGGWTPGQQGQAPQPVNPAPIPAPDQSSPPQAIQPPAAPADASPIAVGNYQMPRAGSPDLYQPQQAALPVNAQPTQGQLPTTQQVQQDPNLPASLNPNTPGFMNFYQSMKNGGGLIGSIYAGLTGQRLDSAGIKQQQLQAQYQATRQALIQNGTQPQQASSMAMLSVLNPEAAKTVLPELLTNKEKWGVVREDPLEGKQYGFVNERDQTVNGRPLGAGAGQSTGLQGLTDKLTDLRTRGATTDQMLSQIPSGYRDDVKAMGEGRGVPANLGRAATRGPLLTLTKVVYPNFDETQIPARVAMRKDFAGEGKNGQAIVAFNTVQHHLDQVSDAAEEFFKAGGGSNYPSLNALKAGLASNTGWDPKLRDAAQKLTDKMNAAEHEVTNAYNAGHISDTDRKTWETIKSANLPANQMRQRLADFEDLLSGKRDSLNHMYRTSFGEDAPTIDRQANEATMKKLHSRLENGQSSYGSSSPGGKPSVVIQNGHTYTLQPDGSYK